MDRASKLLVIGTVGLIVTFGNLGASADSRVAGDDGRIRTLVHDEVERQLKDRVQAEVKRQLTELVRQAQSVRPTTAAKVNSLQYSIATIRSQLALYSLQHKDAYPTLSQLNDNWSVLTSPTDDVGAVGPRKPFGPYLKSPPRNPFNGSFTVAPAGHATARDGWSYDEKTHYFRAVVPENVEPTLREGEAEGVKGWRADSTAP